MKYKAYIILSIALTILACRDYPVQNTSSASSRISTSEENWVQLFNGKDLSDWDIKIAGHSVGENYKNTFSVKDSILQVSYDEYETFNNSFGHLYYKKAFSYYKIKLDYRFTGEQVNGGESWANRNSGIMLHAQSAESNSIGQFFPVSIEFQFLGGLGDGHRPTGNLCTPGTAVTMNDSINFQHCINSTSKTYNGHQWVSVEAIVLGDEKIIHIIESDTVMQYSKPVIGGGLISKNSDAEWKATGIENQEEWLARDGEPLKEGYIALQAESTPMEYRNIELLDLCGCMDKKAKNYKNYFVKEDNTTCIYD